MRIQPELINAETMRQITEESIVSRKMQEIENTLHLIKFAAGRGESHVFLNFVYAETQAHLIKHGFRVTGSKDTAKVEW